MKRLLVPLFLLLLQQLLLAQVMPTQHGFYFQGIARETNGTPVANAAVSISISITTDSIPNVIYAETHKTTTDAFGLFKVVVGMGSASKGTFYNISWESPRFLVVGIDTKGGTNYVTIGATQILPVPTAKYAEKAGNTQWYPTKSTGIFTPHFLVGIGNVEPLATLDVSKTMGSEATTAFRGTKNASQFNYSIDENTFIRGGKDGAIVSINDGNIGNVHLVSGGGKVGVGMGSPQGTLDVFKGTNVAAGLFRGSSYPSRFAYSTTEDTYIRGGKDGGKVVINDLGIGDVLLAPDGRNVGIAIGTNAPTATFDVGRGTGADGTAIFRGTKHVSHFNYSTNETTYIRGGKDGSSVVINDNNIGNVYLSPNGGNVQIGTDTIPLLGRGALNVGVGGINVQANSMYGMWGIIRTGLTVHDRGDAYAASISSAKGMGLVVSGARTAISTTGDVSVSGNIYHTGSVLNSSDKRYKRDITGLTSSLSKTLQLKGVNYYYKSEAFSQKKFSERLQIGFIAQEVRKIVPELVLEDQEGYLSVDYSKLTPLLVEAIKEQQVLIQQLKNENSFVHQRLAAIEAQLAKKTVGSDHSASIR